MVSYALVLSGTAQRASNAYGGASAGNAINPAQDIPYRQLLLWADNADGFMGGEGVTTATGGKIDSSENLPTRLGPFDQGPLKLSDIWLVGSGATVRIVGIPF